MGISHRHRFDARHTPIWATVDSSILRDLVEAREELDHARRKAKWIRKSKDLHRATRAVENAALAARRAGVGWNDIGDVLGLERAIAPTVTSIAAARASIEAGSVHRRGDLPEYDAAVAL